MIEISQEEFEQRIRDVIQGKTTRKKLVKDLQIDARTLNNKIQELAGNNISLYLEFIEKFPYKAREREDINFEALLIEMIKEGSYTEDIAKKYEVGERTIRRKINEIGKTNPDLIFLYKEVKRSNRHRGAPILPEIQEKIDKLVIIPVKLSEQNEIREEQLKDVERIFLERSKTMTREKAALSMGLTYNRVYKLLNELYRIRIEKQHKDVQFRETLKVEISGTEYNNPNNNDTKEITDKNHAGKAKGED